MVVILLASGWIGAYAAGSIREYLFPYIIYGVDKVGSQNIKVIDYHDGKFFLSNGEIVPTDKSPALDMIVKATFVLVGGSIMLMGYAVVRRLTTIKSLPDFYDGLAYFGRQKSPPQP
jgi:hypothetical protein